MALMKYEAIVPVWMRVARRLTSYVLITKRCSGGWLGPLEHLYDPGKPLSLLCLHLLLSAC